MRFSFGDELGQNFPKVKVNLDPVFILSQQDFNLSEIKSAVVELRHS